MLLTIIYIFLQLFSSFWTYWGDGQAEVNVYQLVQNRYGEEREAQLVLVYVTEPFNLIKQVKSDTYDPRDKNQTQVMKLNRIKQFRTGIYQYHIMSSVFTTIDRYKIGNSDYAAGLPLKISFSSQEWCGLVHHQLNRTSDGFRSISHSYFEPESDQTIDLDVSGDIYFADNFYIDVRELFRPFKTGKINLYQTLETTRLLHRPLEKLDAEVSVHGGSYLYQNKEVNIRRWTIKAENQTWHFSVEKEYPHRILAFEHWYDKTRIEYAQLKKSERLAYWKLNKNSDEFIW